VQDGIKEEALIAFYALLHTYVEDHYRTYLQRHLNDGCEAFLQLQRHCAQSTAEDKAIYNRKFLQLDQGPSELASSYIERFNKAHKLATLVNNCYTDEDVVDMLLQGFGTQRHYEATVSSLKEARRRDGFTGTNTVTLETIESVFFNLDEHKSGKSKASAYLADSGSPASNQRGHFRGRGGGRHGRGGRGGRGRFGRGDGNTNPRHSSRPLSEITCFKCQQKGHYANTCPSRTTPQHALQASSPSLPDPLPIEHAAMATSRPSSTYNSQKEEHLHCSSLGCGTTLNNWLADSGATAHMTPCLDDLINVQDNQDVGVQLADGYTVHCTHIGQVMIKQLDDKGHPFSLRLERVLYVPGLRQRLFSVPTFTSGGHGALFHSTFLTLYLGDVHHPSNIITLPLGAR
ncbi:MAG: hypothetical protein ACRDL7_09730, partial [Gaiellaceae bacterium]